MLRAVLSCLFVFVSTLAVAEDAKTLRVGMIGLDTSHCIAFTRILNDEDAAPEVANCKVVAVYPKGSPDIESSVKRVPEYTKTIQELGVEIRFGWQSGCRAIGNQRWPSPPGATSPGTQGRQADLHRQAGCWIVERRRRDLQGGEGGRSAGLFFFFVAFRKELADGPRRVDWDYENGPLALSLRGTTAAFVRMRSSQDASIQRVSISALPNSRLQVTVIKRRAEVDRLHRVADAADRKPSD